jgi:hypothetical protein
MQQAGTICKNCGNNFTGKYCNNCGEKIYHAKDKNVWHLLGEAFHFTTHFEGTFFNTVKAILTRPGKLSLDYCNGIRKKYFKPISFFLLLVIIYLLFPVFEGLNQDLIYYTRNPLYGEYAMQKSLYVMQAKGLSEQELTLKFHQEGEMVSKFLLFIIIPIMALFSWLIAFKKRRLYFDHFIFSIEESAWLILWGFLLLPVIWWLLGLIGPGLSEIGIMLSIIMGFVLHLFFAAQRFFTMKWYYNILFCVLYTFALALVVQYLYKFILFVITINQI